MSSSGNQYQDVRRFSDGGRPGDMQLSGGDKYGDDFYIYPSFVASLTAGQSASVAVIIQQDAAFEWIETTYSGSKHGVSQPQSNVVLPISVQVTDSGNGRALFFSPVPIGSVAGDGKQPFILPVSKVFVPLSTVTISFNNFDAADQYDNIYFNLVGRRVYEYGPGQRGIGS